MYTLCAFLAMHKEEKTIMATYEEKEKISVFGLEGKAKEEAFKALNKLATDVISEEIITLDEEKYWVSEWLIRHGGSFAQGIGIALSHAHPSNAQRIKMTWSEIWKEAWERTETRRKNKEYY